MKSFTLIVATLASLVLLSSPAGCDAARSSSRRSLRFRALQATQQTPLTTSPTTTSVDPLAVITDSTGTAEQTGAVGQIIDPLVSALNDTATTIDGLGNFSTSATGAQANSSSTTANSTTSSTSSTGAAGNTSTTLTTGATTPSSTGAAQGNATADVSSTGAATNETTVSSTGIASSTGAVDTVSSSSTGVSFLNETAVNSTLFNTTTGDNGTTSASNVTLESLAAAFDLFRHQVSVEVLHLRKQLAQHGTLLSDIIGTQDPTKLVDYVDPFAAHATKQEDDVASTAAEETETQSSTGAAGSEQ